MTESFYDVLGVPEDASQETITDAYRERVKEVHPDVSDEEDAAERFKRVSKAEEVLTDEHRRSRYDRLGHEAYLAREQGQGSSPGGSNSSGDGRNFGDIRDAAAWASENTGRSGPTNRGADAGWRQRERRRHGNTADSWDIGGEDGWDIGDLGGKRGTNSGDWEFGGHDWDLGDDDDWDLGANWGGDQGDDENTTGSQWSAGSDDEDWNARQREKAGTSGGGRDPFADDGGLGGSSSGGATARDAAGGTDRGAGVSTDGFGRTTRGGAGDLGSVGATSTDGGSRATARRQHVRESGPAGDATTPQWNDDESGYSVNDWVDEPDDQTEWFSWPELQDDNPGLIVGTFFMIPLMLLTSVLPAFPLPINVVIGICTLLVTGYLITRPALGILVFSPWAILLPFGLGMAGLGLDSPLMLSALVGTWVPLAYAALISFSLEQ
jgi:hypothetical protein